MFNLTANERNALHRLEMESFKRYCRLIDVEPIEYEAYLLATLKSEWRRWRDVMEVTARTRPGAAEEYVRRYEGAQTFWEYKRVEVIDHVERIVENIRPLVPALPINWTYLGNIARRFGATVPKEGDVDSLAALLRELPHVQTYEIEMNAFVTAHSPIGTLPAVFVYEHLMVTLDVFLQTVLAQVIVRTPHGTAFVVDESLWDLRGRNEAFVAGLRSVVEMLLGRTGAAVLDERLLLSHASPELFNVSRAIGYGAGEFVRLHEYAHLLLGHLELPAGPQLELAADRFAYDVIDASDESIAFWARLGAIGALVAFVLVEVIERRISDTHPPALARIKALLHKADRETAWLRWHVVAMLAVCCETLQREYGVPAEGISKWPKGA